MEYTFIQSNGSENNLRLYSNLLSVVFPETKKYTFDFLNWQYNLNPNGKVIGYDAFYGNELAAHYVTIPVLFRFKGKAIKGLLSLNTATHPNHQGKKLFTKLAEKTYELGGKEGYQFVIGVANQNSTHGFITKLGFKLVSPLEVKIFLGKSKNITVDSDMFCSSWNTESVLWRSKNPSANYYNLSNKIICDTHVSFIKAVLSQRKDISANNLKPKNGLFKMLIGLNNTTGRMAIAVNLPDKFKPAPLNLILKPLGDFNLNLSKENIYFELLDFDAY